MKTGPNEPKRSAMHAKRPGWLRHWGLWQALSVAGVFLALCGLGYPALFGGSDRDVRVSAETLASTDLTTSPSVPAVFGTPKSTTPTGAPSTSATGASATAKPTATPSATPSKTTAPTTPPATTAAGAAPLAGKIKPGVTTKGVATFYQG